MDAKITLSFNEAIIAKAKDYAEKQHISLSRLIEMLLFKIVHNDYATLEDYPISSWVEELSAGTPTYKTEQKSRAAMKTAFYENSIKKDVVYAMTEPTSFMVAENNMNYSKIKSTKSRKPKV